MLEVVLMKSFVVRSRICPGSSNSMIMSDLKVVRFKVLHKVCGSLELLRRWRSGELFFHSGRLLELIVGASDGEIACHLLFRGLDNRVAFT